LNDLLARLKESVERERSFIADAAHELRTPLTALDLQVQSLRAEAAGSGHDEAVQRLEAGVARAARLVEQLLALAREERDGSREHEPVALAEVAREVIEVLPRGPAWHRPRHGAVGCRRVTRARRCGAGAQPARQCHSFPEGGRVDVSDGRHDDKPLRAVLVVSTTTPASRHLSAKGCSIASIECPVLPRPAAAWGWRWCVRSPRITTRTFNSAPAPMDAGCG
jgi:hypothetical protein